MPPKHYIIVRKDLPVGVMAAMVVHAAGRTGSKVADYAHAVVLQVNDGESVVDLASKLAKASVEHLMILENEEPWNGAPMAIGIPPMEATAPLRKILKNLKLLT